MVADNLAREVTKLKEQPGGPVVLFGGAQIAAQLMRLGVIGAYRLFVHPVGLGGGSRLFPEAGARTGLRLVETRGFDSSVVQLHCQRA